MIRISPMQSRARTPTFSASEGPSSPVEYFSLQPHGRPSSVYGGVAGESEAGQAVASAAAIAARKQEARKSLSGSSVSSTSSRTSRQTLRQLGYG